MYGHDIAAIPALVKPLLGDTTPEAVIQPENERELIDLVHWAADERIPLTPRGKSTSGYGGAIPVKKGIVIDFYRMKNVIELDEKNKTATIEPGFGSGGHHGIDQPYHPENHAEGGNGNSLHRLPQRS